MAMDFDTPWKEVLDQYFQPLMWLCFPHIAREINWNAGVEMLETELHELMRESKSGRQHVDKLVRVYMKNGEARRVLIHVEVQHHPEPKFAERLFSYHIRLLEKGDPVSTLAILGDMDPKWRPSRLEREVLGCRVVFDFPVCKLLDLLESREELEKSHDPAALLVVANWAAQITRGDDRERKRWKTRLIKGMYEKGFRREDILGLYRFIDWLMALPEELEREFKQEILKLEKEKNMPYVTSIERMGKEEGRQEGRQEGLAQGIEKGRQVGIEEGARAAREMIKDFLLLRFGEIPGEVLRRLESAHDLTVLQAYHRLSLTSQNLDEFASQIEKMQEKPF